MLIAEIERAKIRGLDINNTKFGIIIECKGSSRLTDAIESENNNNSIEELEKVVRDEQSSLMAKLNNLQATENMKILPFANAIYAELTFDQIREISKLKDIKTIRLSKTEHVTC
jgi:hypothetical protein